MALVARGAQSPHTAPTKMMLLAMQPASCLPSACFCEAVRASPVAQPVNTGTSLAFLAAAVIVTGARRRAVRVSPRENLMLTAPVYTLLYCVSLVVIGFGSMFYHASLTFAGQTADVAGMYLLATFLVLYNAGRLRPITPLRTAVLYVGINGALITLLVVAPALRRYVFGAMILCAIVLEFRVRAVSTRRVDSRLFAAALMGLAVGFAFWILDITHVVCRPTSMFQGHGVWHICGAIATVLMYLYYVSEEPGLSVRQ
jgi:hypothetical protein